LGTQATKRGNSGPLQNKKRERKSKSNVGGGGGRSLGGSESERPSQENIKFQKRESKKYVGSLQ